MNYGYQPTAFDGELAERMSNYLLSLPPDSKGRHPYIEVNGLYPGVRIRRITHYPEEIQDKIIKNCDALYREVENIASN